MEEFIYSNCLKRALVTGHSKKNRKVHAVGRGVQLALFCIALTPLFVSCVVKKKYESDSYQVRHWGGVVVSGPTVRPIGSEESKWDGEVVTKDSLGRVIGIVNYNQGRASEWGKYKDSKGEYSSFESFDSEGFVKHAVLVYKGDTILVYMKSNGCVYLRSPNSKGRRSCPEPPLRLRGGSVSRFVMKDSGFVIADINGDLHLDVDLEVVLDERMSTSYR